MRNRLTILALLTVLVAGCVSRPRSPSSAGITVDDAIALATDRLAGVEATNVSSGRSAEAMVELRLSPEDTIMHAKNQDTVTIRGNMYRVVLIPRRRILSLHPIEPEYLVTDSTGRKETEGPLNLGLKWPNKSLHGRTERRASATSSAP